MELCMICAGHRMPSKSRRCNCTSGQHIDELISSFLECVPTKTLEQIHKHLKNSLIAAYYDGYYFAINENMEQQR